jgi:hypothetical protein
MNLFGLIQKSKIKEYVIEERRKERREVEKIWRDKIENALVTQDNEHNIQIQIKDAEVAEMVRIVQQYKQRIKEAEEKEFNAKKIMFAVKEMVDRLDFEYKSHAENDARSYHNVSLIKDDLDNHIKSIGYKS